MGEYWNTLTHTPTHIQIRTRRFGPGSLETWRRKWSKKKARGDFMQIRTPPLSGNQRQASSSPELSSFGHKGQRERGRERNSFQRSSKFPHLPLEEAVHFVVPFINVSLSFSLSPFSIYFKGASEQATRSRRRSHWSSWRYEAKEVLKTTQR